MPCVSGLQLTRRQTNSLTSGDNLKQQFNGYSAETFQFFVELFQTYEISTPHEELKP
jgi:hypothetical protein